MPRRARSSRFNARDAKVFSWTGSGADCSGDGAASMFEHRNDTGAIGTLVDAEFGQPAAILDDFGKGPLGFPAATKTYSAETG